MATKRKADIITRQDLYNAISEVRHGSPTYAKSQRLVEKFRRLLTFHELSHALTGKFLSISSIGYAEHWCDYLTKITIIGAGGAGGYSRI